MISTCGVWVCSKCGTVSHLEGTVQPSNMIHGDCPAITDYPGREVTREIFKHSFKLVTVMVPWA